MAASRIFAALCLLAALGGSFAIPKWADKFSEGVAFRFMLPTRSAPFNTSNIGDLVDAPGFDKNRTTVFYMHGYTETGDSESVQVVSDAFLKRGDFNFVLCDWSAFSVSPYVRAFFNLYQVYRPVAAAIESMVKRGMSPGRVWLVTHSMGSQLGSVVAKDLTFKLPRITALDPARPGFDLKDIPSLNRSDAAFVDVIHTDAGFYGLSQSIGHVDFYPNKGKRLQPGCPGVLAAWDRRFCSHHVSWRLFAESLQNETAFPAQPCASWKDFESEACSTDKRAGEPILYMGIRAVENKVASGDYFLSTNGQAPFGRGVAGLKRVSGLFQYVTDLIYNSFSSAVDFGWDKQEPQV